MKLQRLSLIVLFLLVGGLVTTMAGELLHSAARADQVSHSKSPSCPDRGGDGDPCDPTCPCACCPGQSAAAAFWSVHPSIQAPPSDELHLSSPDDPQPKDVHSSIFHPPRA